MALPPHSPAQSCTQSLKLSLSHTLQLSKTASPFGVPAQSAHELLSPSHTLHSSIIALPSHMPKQS